MMSGNTERNELEEALVQLRELEGITTRTWNEKRTLEERVVALKMERLRRENFMSRLTWNLKVSRNRFGDRLFLEAVEGDVDALSQELEFYFGHWGSWGGLYTFPDGLPMKFYYNADDALFTIDIDLGSRTLEEYLEAFDVLGIEISFVNIDNYIGELRAKAAELERLVNLLR